MFSPHKAYTMKSDDKMVDSLQVFPFLVRLIPLLKLNAGELPYWSSAAQKVLVLQPSSAATERVFSHLKALFNDQQDHILQDCIEMSLMLQYNNC